MTLHTDLESSLLRRFANHWREIRDGKGGRGCTYCVRVREVLKVDDGVLCKGRY